MKVFEVQTERLDGDNYVKQVEYVTHCSDDLLAVAEHYRNKCMQLEMELISVRHFLTVSNQIN